MAKTAFVLDTDEFHMLNGLRFAGNAYISASEHNMALALCERGLADAWTAVGGFHAWRLTDRGREIVERQAAAYARQRMNVV